MPVLPLDRQTMIAAGDAHLEHLRLAHGRGCLWDASTTAGVAKCGQLACLRYAHENGCSWDTWTTTNAAENGQLACLQYAHEQGCLWDRSATASAAKTGQLACLRYAREQGCPWDEWTAVKAAENGQLACLRYAHDQGCPWDERICTIIFDGCEGTFCESCRTWTNQRVKTQPALLEALLVLHVSAAKEVASLIADFTCEL